MLPLALGTPGKGLGAETSQAPHKPTSEPKNFWSWKKKIPKKHWLISQQHTKAMIISNLKPHMVAAPPQCTSYTLNLAKWHEIFLRKKWKLNFTMRYLHLLIHHANAGSGHPWRGPRCRDQGCHKGRFWMKMSVRTTARVRVYPRTRFYTRTR
jgi:hypothetical protein